MTARRSSLLLVWSENWGLLDMARPKVSVLLSVYNEEKNIGNAIQSCLHQSFGDFELIIVDDGSTDRTLEVIESFAVFDTRIKFISRPNKGLAASLNDGLSEAKGEWVARMDADDISLPERLAVQLNYVYENPNVDVLGAAAYMRSQKGEQLGVFSLPSQHERLEKTIHRSSPFIHPSVIFKKEAVKAVGGYDERLRWAQDYDLWSRMIGSYNFHNLEEPLIIYTMPTGSSILALLTRARVRIVVGFRQRTVVRATFRAALGLFKGLLVRVGLYRSRADRGYYKGEQE